MKVNGLVRQKDGESKDDERQKMKGGNGEQAKVKP